MVGRKYGSSLVLCCAELLPVVVIFNKGKK